MTGKGSFLAAIGIVSLLLPVASVTPPVADAQGQDQWVSPTYGFTVSWDPDLWTEEPSEALSGEGPDQLDRLLLLGDIGPLYIEGARRYEGIAGNCVAGELEALEDEPDFSEASRLPEYDADGPDASAGAVRAILTQDDGDEVPVIAYVQCMRAGEDSVAIGTLLAPVRDFPGHLRDAEPVLASITPAGPAAGSDIEFAAMLDAARANEPLLSGASGSLVFGPGLMATSESGVVAADFAASATFANPWNGADQPFDFGFAFRHTGTDEHLRLVIDANGIWALQNGLETVASGAVDGVRAGAGESNTIDLVARGGDGWFAVNGAFAGMLDLSGRITAGDVLPAAGFFSENATLDGEIRFTRFSVWPLETDIAPDASTGMTGTNTATLDQRAFNDLIAEATDAESEVGPLSGLLVESEGAASLEPAGVALADFAAQVRWVNPDQAGAWEIGVAFRDQPDGGHYRLTFNELGEWLFGLGAGEKSATGQTPSLRLEPGAQNALELVVTGEMAAFAINGVFVAELDVSEITAPGDVWFGSGFDIAATVPDRETRFRDFTVWPVGSGMLPAVDATAPAADDGLFPLPTREPGGDDDSADTSGMSESVLAVLVEEEGGSGISGLATISEDRGEARIDLVIRGGVGGELAVIHEGTCDSLSAGPAFLLEDVDAAGGSETNLGAPASDLFLDPLSIAIYSDIASYGDPVACGEIR